MNNTDFNPDTTVSTIDTPVLLTTNVSSASRSVIKTTTIRDIATAITAPANVEKLRASAFVLSTLTTRDAAEQLLRGHYVGMALDFDEVSDNQKLLDFIERHFGKMVYLAYSTKSATTDNQKMRVVIPFDAPLDGQTYKHLVDCIVDELTIERDDKGQAIEPVPAIFEVDDCLGSINQVAFMPNVGELYTWTISDGQQRITDDNRIVANVVLEIGSDHSLLFNPLELYASQIEERAQAAIDAELEKRIKAEKRRLKRSPRPVGAHQSVIDWFKDVHLIEDLVGVQGYSMMDHKKGTKCRHPNSKSGSFSGLIFMAEGVQRYFTLSTDDPLYDKQHRSHDAFSVFTVLDFNGDFEQALAEAKRRKSAGSFDPTTSSGKWEDLPVTPPKQDKPEVCKSMPTIDYEITPFRGAMAELVDSILATSHKPQPTLAVASALAGMAASIPKCYRMRSGMRLALYTLIMSPTASGKEHIEKACARIAMDMDSNLVSGSLSSGQGIEDELIAGADKPNLMVISEAGHILQSLNGDGRSQQSHLVHLMNLILQTYSAGGSFLRTRSLAGKPSQTIDNPVLHIFGASTPEKLADVLRPENITEGFLNRMLVVMGKPNVPLVRGVDQFTIPESIKSTKFDLIRMPNDDVVITIDPSARSTEDRIMRKYEKPTDDVALQHLLGRSHEKVLRIAGTLAVWDMTKDRTTPVITEEHLRWAEKYVDASNQTMYRFMNDFMFDEKVHKDAKKILDQIEYFLTREGSKLATAPQRVMIDRGFVPRSLVLRRSKLTAERLTAAVIQLQMAEQIEVHTMATDAADRPATGFRRVG